MVENLIEGVVKLQARLDNAGVSSVVIGGLAVVVWGEPRLTRDVNIKVRLQRDGSAALNRGNLKSLENRQKNRQD